MVKVVGTISDDYPSDRFPTLDVATDVFTATGILIERNGCDYIAETTTETAQAVRDIFTHHGLKIDVTNK
jgi:hypothetical protein